MEKIKEKDQEKKKNEHTEEEGRKTRNGLNC